MPTNYNCECCKFHTQIKTNYLNHMSSYKHNDIVKNFSMECKYCNNIISKININDHYVICKNKKIFDNLILEEFEKQSPSFKANLEIEYVLKMNKLVELHNIETKNLEKKNFNMIAKKNKEHKKEIKNEINNIKNEYRNEIQNIKQEYKLAVENHKTELDNIKQEHKLELENVKRESKLESDNYKIELENLKCEYKTTFENAKQEYKKDLESYKKESLVINATLCDAKDKHIETVETIIKTCGKITEKSVEGMVSALTYANTELVNGPILTKLCKFDFVDDEDGVNDLLHYSTENMLHEYIGDIIIGLYKKDKPIDQALWNTDSSRLVYIIRQKVDTKTLWEKDLNLERIKSFIVAPIIEYFIECIDNVKTKANKFINKHRECGKRDKMWNLVAEKKQMCVDLIHIKTTLLNPKLSKHIIKYITPKFCIGPQLAMAKQK
jgi:hypothetical protein